MFPLTLRDFFLRSPALVALVCVALGGGCELVLGTLPKAKQHPDGGSSTGGAGGTGGTIATGGAGTTNTTGSTSTGGGAGGGECCDCDGDHILAKGLCGGTDCDDGDKRVYPDQPVYYAEASPNPAVGFDWDCNGKPEQDPSLLVTVDCGLIGLPCAAGTGYLAKVPPPCGQGAPWGSCKQDGLGCVQAVVEQNKVMTCK